MKRPQISQIKAWLRQAMEIEEKRMAAFANSTNSQIQQRYLNSRATYDFAQAALMALEGEPVLLKTYVQNET